MHRRGRHLPYAPKLIGFAVAVSRCGGIPCSAGHADSLVSLLQERIHFHGRLPSPGRAAHRQSPFCHAIVVSIDPEAYASQQDVLEAQGVAVEPFWGFKAKNASELAAALEVLRGYNNTDSLHQTLGNGLACMHMSPGTLPHIRWALIEKMRSFMHRTVKNVDDLLQFDHHQCVPKMVAIAASQVRVWEGLVSGRFPPCGEPAVTGQRVGADLVREAVGDPWYLVMEDDAHLCPGWRERMEAELPRLPADADIVKLFFFGHWRKWDQLPDAADGTPSPFLRVEDPMSTWDIAKASAYEFLHGNSFDTVPISGFYAGTQAYLIKRSSARKLLDGIRGKPFQDVDMTMMSSVKHYVWRMPLAMSSPSSNSRHTSLMQMVPVCNREPPKDWFFQR